MLVRIASNKTLRNLQFRPRLSKAIDALYELSRMEAKILEQDIAAGLIHPGLTAEQARALVRQHRENSAAKENK